jgi:16S rRNA (cytosine1402-N4)-methyltransferase
MERWRTTQGTGTLPEPPVFTPVSSELATPEPRHIPVLSAEVLTWLDPRPGQTVVDATVGAGGHSRLLAERLGPAGRLIGLDQDASMLALARSRITGCPVTLVHSNFDRLRAVLDELGIDRVDGVLADLGFASDQVERAERGFSFQAEGPLDMRMNPDEGEPASRLLARLDERSLADLFWEYGEERYSRRIARKIVEVRKQTPIETTTQLAELVRRCVPRPKGRGPRIDPATRVFQALRIAVNDELGALERLLAQLPASLKPGGRAVIISFHSLEDRRVKQAFRDREMWDVLTRKPITASDTEQRNNPRARSAKLRAAVLRSGEREAPADFWRTALHAEKGGAHGAQA